MTGPQISWLPDGRRLHMNHGPIDLIVEAWGEADEVRLAYGQAAARFETILTELVGELAALRSPVCSIIPPPLTPPHKGEGGVIVSESPSPLWGGVRGGGSAPPTLTDPAARRMFRAVVPYAEQFITPMAAVAGAVADEMLAAMVKGRKLSKAYVNDGGDIALHVSPGESLTLAIAGAGNGFDDRVTITHDMPIRGIATSGWRGRSFSLGIADAVTVLAANGAAADAAATIIANVVDLPDHPAIERQPANELQPDSDLGDRLVTTGVGKLTPSEIAHALAGGVAEAERLVRRGLIHGAALFLAGETRAVGYSQSSLRVASKDKEIAHA